MMDTSAYTAFLRGSPEVKEAVQQARLYGISEGQSGSQGGSAAGR